MPYRAIPGWAIPGKATPGWATEEALVVVGQAIETDTAQTITPKIVLRVVLGQVVETDTAQAITPELVLRVIVGQAIETSDAALSVTPILRARKPITWTLFIRDSDLSRLGEIPDFQRLEAVLRFNGVGTWVLDLDYSTAAAAAYDFDKGIIAERDGTVVFSGPVTKMRREWAYNRDRLIVSGVDDSVWLARRLAYPVPGGNFALAEHDVRTDVAETVLLEYVDFNLGPSAITAREVPGLALAADGARGSTVTGRARFQSVLDLLTSLALAGGDLGFRIIQEGSGIEFQVYEPRDQTAAIIFSKSLSNLASFDHESQGPGANYFIGAGAGEGTARTFVEKGDAPSIAGFGRIEEFRDRRDTADAGEIEQTLDEEIAASADRTALSVKPSDTHAFAFLTGYALGDRVTAVVDGVPTDEVIRELTITLTPREGERIVPIIGTPGVTNPSRGLAFAQRLKEHRARILDLERR